MGPGHRLFGWNNGLNRQVLGGWQISGITTLQTGAPFTVVNTSADFSGFNQFNDRPDVVGTGPLTQNNRTPDNAFDKTYFSPAPPTGRVGTSGRNQYYGPGLANYNFSAGKNFPLVGERLRLRFQADFLNLFNHSKPKQRELRQDHGNGRERDGDGGWNNSGRSGRWPTRDSTSNAFAVLTASRN